MLKLFIKIFIHLKFNQHYCIIKVSIEKHENTHILNPGNLLVLIGTKSDHGCAETKHYLLTII